MLAWREYAVHIVAEYSDVGRKNPNGRLVEWPAKILKTLMSVFENGQNSFASCHCRDWEEKVNEGVEAQCHTAACKTSVPLSLSFGCLVLVVNRH